MKKVIKKYTIIIITCLLLFWIASIVKCEILTLQHGNEFLKFNEVNEAEIFKIISYSDDFARIYCITKNRESGTIHNFIKENNEWKYNQWEGGGWSKSGSADGFVWPYIR